jgi:hypothetical protein
MKKAKFSKRKCLRCKYHGIGCGGYTTIKNGKSVQVYCNYSVTEDTCLKLVDGKVIDQRGDDYYNCKLFSEGRPENEQDY